MKKIFSVMLAGIVLALSATAQANTDTNAQAAIDAASKSVDMAVAAGLDQNDATEMLTTAKAKFNQGDTAAAIDFAERAEMIAGLDMYETYFNAGLEMMEGAMPEVSKAAASAVMNVNRAKSLGYESSDADEMLVVAYKAVVDGDTDKALDYFERAEMISGCDAYEDYFLKSFDS